MIKLLKLSYEPCLEYLKDTLSDTTALASKILSLMDLKKGFFFTFLPSKTNFSLAAQFNISGIAKGVREQIPSMLINKLQEYDPLCCIFDNISEVFSSKYKSKLFSKCGLFYREEIYYLINKENISLELIKECLQNSNAIWHSLCVVSKLELKINSNRNVLIQEIDQIILNTSMLIVGAYDGEGYLFWEKFN